MVASIGFLPYRPTMAKQVTDDEKEVTSDKMPRVTSGKNTPQKRGPKNFDAPTLTAMKNTYLEANGQITAVVKKFGVSHSTAKRIALRDKWPQALVATARKADEIMVKSHAEHRTSSLVLIDKFIDHQMALAETGVEFDAAGVAKLIATRALLTGNPTERIEMSLQNFIVEWMKLPESEREAILARHYAQRTSSE